MKENDGVGLPSILTPLEESVHCGFGTTVEIKFESLRKDRKKVISEDGNLPHSKGCINRHVKLLHTRKHA